MRLLSQNGLNQDGYGLADDADDDGGAEESSRVRVRLSLRPGGPS